MATDDDVRDLLRTLTPNPEVAIDVDAVRRGSRRRSGRIAVVAVAAIVAVVGGSAVATGMLRGEDTTTNPIAPATSTDTGAVTEDCPAPVPGLEIASTGVPDDVFVLQREFERVPDPGSVQLGGQVAAVTCTIADQSPEHDRPAYAYWHEGNAGYLPLGTPIREVIGHDARCRIAAEVDGETRVYATNLERAGDCRPEAGTNCPESRLLPEGTLQFEHWGSFVRWGARTYYPPLGEPSSQSATDVGSQVGIVTCNIVALTANLERDREVTGPVLQGNATFLPVGTTLHEVPGYPVGCRIAAAVDGQVTEFLASREGSDQPLPCAMDEGTQSGVHVEVPTHCGVTSVTVEGRLWLADPPLGDHNPPPGWDENSVSGEFVVTGHGRAEFHGDGGQSATFKLASEGVEDPNAGCE